MPTHTDPTRTATTDAEDTVAMDSEDAATTMNAVVRDQYGPPASLTVERVARPVPGPGQLLVRVRAAGVDQGVWHLVTGLPYPVRAASFGLRRPKNRLVGRDVAGVVEVAGPGTTGFAPGDAVFGTGDGAYADYVLVDVERCVHKPQNVTFEQAAAVPTSGYAALQGLRDRGGLTAGQRVLVIGAAGGVGRFAVPIARHLGAHVTGVCRTAAIELVRGLGADAVVDYTREPITGRYDLILDTGGNRPLREVRRLLTERGTLVIVGAEVPGWSGGTERQLQVMARAPFARQRLRALLSRDSAADLAELRTLLEDGILTPPIDRAFPFTEAGTAIEHLRTGHPLGKVILVP